MATISELVVKVIADTTGLDSGLKNAQTSIKGVGEQAKDADGKTSGLSSAFSSLKGALVAGGTIAAVTAASKAIYDSVQAFGEAEIAAKRLDAVAKMRGWVDGADRIGDLSDELQRLTGVDGDYVKQLGAELLAQGKSLDQTEDLITAAAQLSSITGDDLGASVKQLTNTYSGMAGTIGRSIPEIKALSEEELRNGEAVDIILEKYGAFADQLTDTVSVATDRASESMGDLKETLGQAFAPTAVALANGFTNAINAMLPALNYMATHSFSRAIDELIESITGAKGAVTLWEESVAEASRAEASYNSGLRALQTELDLVTEKTKTMSDAELSAARAFLYSQMSRSTSMDQLTAAQKKLDAFDTEIAARRKKEAAEVAKAREEAAKKAADEAVKQAQREEEERKKRTADTITFCIDQEEARSKAVADAYGDAIVESAKAAEKQQADVVSTKTIYETAYASILEAVRALGDYIDASADAQMAAIDAETQAKIIAAGVEEATEIEKIQAELDAAKLAKNAEVVAEKEKELARAKIVEEGEKKKAKIKYDADMYSWAASMALAVAGAAQAIVQGFAQLGPVGGAAAAVVTAAATGLQLAAIAASKPVAPAFARGTDYSPAGMAWINEEGPELVNLPAGTSITPATETPVGSGKNGGNTFVFNSPVALTPSEMQSKMTRTVRRLSIEGVL